MVSHQLFLILVLCMFPVVKLQIPAKTTPQDVTPDDEFRNIDRLRSDLLRNYNSLARPVKHHSTIVNVETAILSAFLSKFDFKLHVLSVDGVLFLMWKDEHLVWDKNSYGGVHEVAFSPYEIWKPDIRDWTSITNEAQVVTGIDRCNLVVMPNGTVTWTPSFHFTVSCPFDLTDFPNDIQTCVIQLGMWASNASEVTMSAKISHFKSTDIELSTSFMDLTEWNILNESLTAHVDLESDGNSYSYVQMYIEAQRGSSMLSLLTRLPYWLASLMAISVFFVTGINSRERISLTLISLMILYGESWLVNNVFLPGAQSITAPYIIKCIELNALFVALNLVISSTLLCLIENSKLPLILDSRLTSILKFLERNSVINMIVCVPFSDGCGSELKNNELVNQVNSLTTGVHSFTADATDQDTEADDAAITRSSDSTTATSPVLTNNRLLILMIDRLLLLQYLIFLCIFHA